MITFGSHGPFDWFSTDDQQLDLLQICPDIVLGKYVAITSIDSGELALGEKERAAGWENRGKIAYSPKVLAVESLPRAGWDEWYVLINPTDLGTSHLAENIFEMPEAKGQLRVFTNYRFTLHLPEMNDLAAMFWKQMEWIQPESYIADNEFLTFVSANKSLFASVRQAVTARTIDD